jgi:rRNA-processing protein FCF1
LRNIIEQECLREFKKMQERNTDDKLAALFKKEFDRAETVHPLSQHWDHKLLRVPNRNPSELSY